MQLFILCLLGSFAGGLWGCQLPHDWRPQTEACRAELVETIVFAKVLALHKDTYSVYNYLPWQYESDLFYSAEIELLCDQAWGSMLEVPAGSRVNITGLGYFPCHSYTVLENNSYYFFLRMDENYNLLPHGVNFQDPIFPETPENHRMFASLFQFSNCSSGTEPQLYTPDWEVQEDYRLLCSTVQRALLEEEERVKTLSQKVRILEKANGHLREKVKNLKRSVRQAKVESKRDVLLTKQLVDEEESLTRKDPKLDSNKRILGKPTGNKV
ncbi:coiled-coil domain-containing protein 3-like [Rhinatrema bivittatum]|uniref:coiled-coil domain-containing protein 3-like n=1 Tax=Rhinatrema bivittatum TaxID=194408 RepID=UPI00112C7F9B|nr:coiled-coil domain-containing protein 3-like [Rhinatrema bivittatum]XP_029456995.1 coiled-coil domain-containing protein 3-like [Rhinatrema bivittatum]